MVKPWYKQFWPWFLIILPLTVVVWTILTVVLFSKNAVSLVAEDYYKKGKGINVDISRVKEAKRLQLNANLDSNDSAVLIHFQQGQLGHYPALLATFTHRTLPDRDFQQMVTSDASGIYRIATDKPIQGPWYVQLEPHTKDWLIQGKVTFPTSDSLLMGD